MPWNIETQIDRNANIPEDLGAVIYDVTTILENFGNDLKQLTEDIKKNRKMVSLSKYEGNIQQEHSIFESNKVHKLKEEIHNLK